MLEHFDVRGDELLEPFRFLTQVGVFACLPRPFQFLAQVVFPCVLRPFNSLALVCVWP